MDKNINSNGYEYVDLCLPSGTLWATCNVGATKPSDYGLYFQWSDTVGYTKNQIGMNKQFKWSIDGSYFNFSKYTTPGNKLELEDDAAHANMGGDWHIPTPKQIQELLVNTISAWTTLNGANGMKFTSKKDASKFIFIPASGSTLDGSDLDAGSEGNIWSSILDADCANGSQHLYFYEGDAYIGYCSRIYWLPVRGVIDGKDKNNIAMMKENETMIVKKINNNGYKYVDLGLPSGTLWATCNVGAKKPSDYGLYFQWGDMQGYTKEQVEIDKQLNWVDYNWDDYKWHLSGFGRNRKFSKYTTPGARLDLEDDAAHVNMGGNWHIPSPSQIKELIDNTTSEWTEQNDVKGRLFTSKKDSSKSIFIPAAGYASDGSVSFIGSEVDVWSSMLSTSSVSIGQHLYFYSSNICLDYGYRYYGFSVRGVIDGKDDYSKNKKRNMEAKEGRSVDGIINQMKNDISIKIKKEDAGYVVVDLLYKDEVIDSDWCVDIDINPLDE